MAYFTTENSRLADEILARYPKPRSAMIPLLHLAQEQSGYVSRQAMVEIAELVDATPAEVLGTLSFYEMFKQTQPGRYQINICHGISCFLCGGVELLHHAEDKLGIVSGGTTPDGMFSLEAVECIAACTEAPALQANYRYFGPVSHQDFDELVDLLAGGGLAGGSAGGSGGGSAGAAVKVGQTEVPPHGVLARVRQHIPPERAAGSALPEVSEVPVWLSANAGAANAGAGAANASGGR